MNILQKYITREALVALILGLVVFTFVLLMGQMMRKLSDMLVNRQMGLDAVGSLIVLTLPYVLTFTLPMAMLAAALLVFGRMSADHEITAMRASGVSLLQVAAPVVLLSLVMAGLAFYVTGWLSPSCRMKVKELFVRTGVERPLAMLEEGTYIRDFPGIVLYIGAKQDSQLFDLIVYSLDQKGNVISSLRARKASVISRPQEKKLILDLQDVRGDIRDPDDPTNFRKIRPGITAHRYPMELDMSQAFRKITKELRDMSLGELGKELGALRARGIYPAAGLMEMHFRFAQAVACVAFTMIGIPLGIKTSRRETSIGIALSLGLAFSYYFMSVLANSLKFSPSLYPEAILWLPILVFQIGGIWLLWRITRV
jgi:lipopolysaccharide export system permease protein